MDQHFGLAHVGSDFGDGGMDRGFVGDIANIGFGVGQFGFQSSKTLSIAREHGNRIAVGGKAAGER